MSHFSSLKNFLKDPAKLYVQDIFRAKQSSENKYIYELFDFTFKNIMIHGVCTSVCTAASNGALNLELSDPTGTVLVYYDNTKNNLKLSEANRRSLNADLVQASRFGDINIQIMQKMMNHINKKKTMIAEGDFLIIVGDIFIESLHGNRMVSAYECNVTSIDRDIIWLEELRYIYDMYYLKDHVKSF